MGRRFIPKVLRKLKHYSQKYNRNGAISSPLISVQLGDEIDLKIHCSVNKNGTIQVSFIARYGIINKTGMKMMFKFNGEQALICDSGVRGLPILSQCHFE